MSPKVIRLLWVRSFILTVHRLLKGRLSATDGGHHPVAVSIIRGGKLVWSFDGETPLNFNFVDSEPWTGKTFYRLDAGGQSSRAAAFESDLCGEKVEVVCYVWNGFYFNSNYLDRIYRIFRIFYLFSFRKKLNKNQLPAADAKQGWYDLCSFR